VIDNITDDLSHIVTGGARVLKGAIIFPRQVGRVQ
jgi:hypothetical protein